MNYTEPFVPIPHDVIPKMLSLARVRPGELVYDLGSGDGRIIITAARDFQARAVGVERRKSLVAESVKNVKELGLLDEVTVVADSFKKADLRPADVLATYLSSYTLNLLAPKFAAELREGVRIVNFDFPILDRKPTRVLKCKPVGWKKAHPIFLYVV